MSDLQNRDYFDMIFMDIVMPMLDGVSATLYIRQNFPAIPVIAMTSNIRPEEVNGYFEHGMHHFSLPETATYTFSRNEWGTGQTFH